MEISGWLIFILLVQVIHGIGTWKLYVKAGRKAWEAFVPVYNGIVLMQIINRPKWWILLLFIPVINLFLFPIIWIETLRTFGKKSTVDMVLGVVTLGFYIAYVNYTQETTYHANRDLTAPNKTMDTLGSLSFAIVVATLVHTYFIQPYTIPTSSLEKSLLVGDFLFVSKFHYGARTPMTPIAAPMVHDTLPIVKVKSYTAKPSLPYFRFPALQKIERNDIVVFNWPADTLFHMYKAADKRYDKPIDKKTNYVKRCTAIPGDNFEIRDGIIFINGKESILPERAKPQYFYLIKSKDASIDNLKEFYQISEGYPLFEIKNEIWDKPELKNELISQYAFEEISRDTLTTAITGQIDQEIYNKLGLMISPNYFYGNLTFEKFEKLKSDSRISFVKRQISKEAEDGIFTDILDGKPSSKNSWNKDNMGPIYIPEAGKTVALNKENLPLYKKVIGEYEGNDLKVNGDEIRINGQIATSYTFKQDYYWMMGDNRHNSLDSRYWGFVPADHIVGKPIFIWMSIDGINDGLKNWSIRWDRLFTTVSGDGQPKSYFQYFLIALAAYFAFDYFRKKKKKKEENNV
ncbi:signal peptidase I [Flavobacterium cheniae]|uniref:Signal peptidase I n=1 Tax=Flavobacterium cheniae TaxID=295428 RepID=A0A562KDM5_9FLAO|nr:signal peptidase I [Flavobacterium cheniae]TDR19665.1 signal peptidase I [Flavobacterium cheniae]TWH93529.1 signal peptidase I [Flavobacterium cheniae]